jgi:hypothetical protein
VRPNRTSQGAQECTWQPNRTSHGAQERTGRPNRASQGAQERTGHLNRTSQGAQERTEQPNRASQGAQERTENPNRSNQGESSQIEPARAPRNAQRTQIEATRATSTKHCACAAKSTFRCTGSRFSSSRIEEAGRPGARTANRRKLPGAQAGTQRHSRSLVSVSFGEPGARQRCELVELERPTASRRE